MQGPVDTLPVTASILQGEVTQCYLCSTESKHTCQRHTTKQGKTKLETTIQFPSFIHKRRDYSFSSLHFPLKRLRNAVYNFSYSVCL